MDNDIGMHMYCKCEFISIVYVHVRAYWVWKCVCLHDLENNMCNTFPSYSFFDRTSGAIYAGVPTVDFGCECKTDDCVNRNRAIKNLSVYLYVGVTQHRQKNQY